MTKTQDTDIILNVQQGQPISIDLPLLVGATVITSSPLKMARTTHSYQRHALKTKDFLNLSLDLRIIIRHSVPLNSH